MLLLLAGPLLSDVFVVPKFADFPDFFSLIIYLSLNVAVFFS